jgi:hypothetical protein
LKSLKTVENAGKNCSLRVVWRLPGGCLPRCGQKFAFIYINWKGIWQQLQTLNYWVLRSSRKLLWHWPGSNFSSRCLPADTFVRRSLSWKIFFIYFRLFYRRKISQKSRAFHQKKISFWKDKKLNSCSSSFTCNLLFLNALIVYSSVENKKNNT